MSPDLRPPEHDNDEFKVFLSYRRGDAARHAGRLFDHLTRRFGASNVFFDVDSVEPGTDFLETIRAAVLSCDVLVAVIGRRWLEVRDSRGDRRIDNTHDFVRLEIEAALHNERWVIPALVDGSE